MIKAKKGRKNLTTDFVIVGATISSLISALKLVKLGADVVVLNEEKFIKHKTEDFLILRDFHIQREFVEKEFKELEVITEKDREKIKTHIVRLDNYKLRKFLIEELLKSGVKIVSNAKLTKISKNYLETAKYKIKYSWMISSDNNAKIREYMNINVKDEYSYELIVRIKKRTRKVQLYLMTKLEPVNSIWVLPNKSSTEFVFSFKDKKDYDKVLKFARLFIEGNFHIKEGVMLTRKIKSNFSGFRFGNAVLIDDSTGLICEATGEKNYYYLRSAFNIEEIILKNNDERIIRDKNLCKLLSKNIKAKKTLDFHDLNILKSIFSKEL